MLIKIVFTISPYLFSMVLLSFSLKNDLQPFNVLFYPFVFLLVSGCFVLLIKNKGRLWFGVWVVFCRIFGLFSIDHVLLNERVYLSYFQESVKGMDDVIFPSPVVFRGLIPFIIFYLIVERISVFKIFSLNKKLSIAISLLFCTYYFMVPLYYTSPSMRNCFYDSGCCSPVIYLFTVLSSALLCAFFEYILIFKKTKHLMQYIFYFILLLFITVNTPVFVAIISGLKSGTSSLGIIILAAKYYLKFVWISSGALYILLLLGWQWFLGNDRWGRAKFGE